MLEGVGLAELGCAGEKCGNSLGKDSQCGSVSWYIHATSEVQQCSASGHRQGSVLHAGPGHASQAHGSAAEDRHVCWCQEGPPGPSVQSLLPLFQHFYRTGTHPPWKMEEVESNLK